MLSPVDLSIVIVNFNTCKLLKECLTSINKYKNDLSIEIIVVDNNSIDKSQNMIRNNFPQVLLIANKSNYYFSKANNQGLNKALGKYLLILAPDTQILPYTLQNMIVFMSQHPTCGLATAKQIDTKRVVKLTCHRQHSLLTEILRLPIWQKFFLKSKVMQDFCYAGWNRKTNKKVDTVPGAFMFMRREIGQQLGFLDDKFKIFYSDADFCKRVNSLGWDILYNCHASIIHITAASINKLPPKELLQIASFDSLHFANKHFNLFSASIISVLIKINLLFYGWLKKYK